MNLVIVMVQLARERARRLVRRFLQRTDWACPKVPAEFLRWEVWAPEQRWMQTSIIGTRFAMPAPLNLERSY